MLKVTCNLSSDHHPQTDGQNERTNKTLEQYLRCFLCYQQEDWANILQFSKFGYNNSIYSSTRVKPFYAYIGYHRCWCVLETPKLPTNLMHRIIWSGYDEFRQKCLSTYIAPNKHKRTMRIIICFHPLLILEIEYGYYDGTWRLLNRMTNWIIDG